MSASLAAPVLSNKRNVSLKFIHIHALDQNVNVSHLGSAILKTYVNLKYHTLDIWTKM